MINLELYKIFYTIVEEGSFSKAAKKIYVTQPAISIAIKKLESQLETQLIIRLHKGIKLTPSGEILFAHLQPAFNIIESGEKELENLIHLKRGKISISGSDTMCMYYLPEYLKIFYNKYPNIEINVANSTTNETIDSLKNGSFDIGVINLDENEYSDLLVWTKEELNQGFFVSKKFHMDFTKEYSISQVSKLPLILLEKGTITRKIIDEYFEKENINVKPILELGSVELLLKYATLQMGLICTNVEYVNKSKYKDDLVQIKLKKDLIKRNIGVVSNKRYPLSVTVKSFIDIILLNKYN